MQSHAKAHLLGAAYNVKSVQTKSGKSMCSFTLRTWEQFKDGTNRAHYIPIVAFSGAADTLLNYLEDRKVIWLECKIEMSKNKDGNDKVNFIVEKFSFIGMPSEDIS